MKKLLELAPTAARLLTGLLFVVFGLNGFLNFIPLPPPEGNAATFMGGLAAVGYFFPLLKGTQILVGLALLAGRYVPLALTVLAPISINIGAFHVFAAPEGLGMAIAVVALNAYLAWAYRSAFRGVLSASAQPVQNSPAENSARIPQTA